MDKIQQRRQKLEDIRKMRVTIPVQAYADIEKDSPSGAVRQWSWWAHVWPRPTEATWDPMLAGSLANAQQSWDESEAFVDVRLKFHQEREQAQQAKQAEEEAKRKARQEEASAALDAELRTKFLATPGATEEDWERSRDRVREDHLMRQASQAENAARAHVRDVMRRVF